MRNSKKGINYYFRLYLTGLAMGTADLIPGVSGGTIAFISGIYEELIRSIKVVTGEAIKYLFRGQLVKAFKIIPFSFLVPLGIGLLSAIFALSNLFSYLLKEQAVFIWSFFFGLVFMSVFVVSKRIKKWHLSHKIGFVASAIFAYFLVGLVPGVTPATLPFFFISGMIAIIAMILPGISGSFILLLLGKYQQVLDAVVERNLIVLGVFILGTIIGIALFSRILSWLFKNHHDISVAILAGFMLGSIRKIWPWKETIETQINSHGEIVPLIEKNILPPNFDTGFFLALTLAVAGSAIVYYFDKVQVIREKRQIK